MRTPSNLHKELELVVVKRVVGFVSLHILQLKKEVGLLTIHEKKLGTFLMRICEKINGKNMKFRIRIFEIFLERIGFL
jgi:hypothetical protein